MNNIQKILKFLIKTVSVAITLHMFIIVINIDKIGYSPFTKTIISEMQVNALFTFINIPIPEFTSIIERLTFITFIYHPWAFIISILISIYLLQNTLSRLR